MPQVKFEKLIEPDEKNSSGKIRERVKKAREIQKERFSKEKKTLNSRRSSGITNSEMNISQIKRYCQIDSEAQEVVRRYVNSGKLSVRGYHRILKVARTIADLERSEKISFHNVTEALIYRTEIGDQRL